jgi:hypothetical protein
VAEGGEHAEGFVDEGFELVVDGAIAELAVAALDDAGDIAGEDAGFAEGMLGEGRIGVAVLVGDGGAITECPDGGVGGAAHGGLDDDAAVLGLFKWKVAEEGVGDRAGGKEDGLGLDGRSAAVRGGDVGAGELGIGGEEDAAMVDGADAGAGDEAAAAPPEDVGGIASEVFLHFGEDAVVGFDEEEADKLAGDAGVIAEEVVGELGELAEEFDSDQPAADDDEGEEFSAEGGIFFDVGLLEEVDHGVAEVNRIAEGFEADGGFGAGDEFAVGDAAEGEDEVVEGEFEEVGSAGGMAGVDALGGEVDSFDVGFDEADFAEHGAQGIDGVAGFEDAGAGFEEEGGHEEVVVAVDEGDFDTCVIAKYFFEVLGCVEPAEAGAEDEDALESASGVAVAAADGLAVGGGSRAGGGWGLRSAGSHKNHGFFISPGPWRVAMAGGLMDNHRRGCKGGRKEFVKKFLTCGYFPTENAYSAQGALPYIRNLKNRRDFLLQFADQNR